MVFLVEGDPQAAQARFANSDKLYFLPNTAAPAVLDALIGRLLGPPEERLPPAAWMIPIRGRRCWT